ncbi:hypothetical protein BB560_005100 [Smittium megazygosporum]|uniref:RNA helicase n=1 Tax=Smittium megazygosporum TaxID=133381 RepID=A0A2T9Z7E5_9FUNG|nr:hypothetical protein BB560_005100 [Smittium megazygosporum]
MSLRQWVSDRLLKLTGVSTDQTVDFVIALASKAKDASSLKKEFSKLGIAERNGDDFTNQLFEMIHPEQIDQGSQNESVPVSRVLEKAVKGKTRSRTVADTDWSIDYESQNHIEEQIKKVKTLKDLREDTESEDEYAKAEKEMEQDEIERDEFVQRLRKRDGEQTKKIVEDKSSTNIETIMKRRILSSNKELRGEILPDLRERSRQQYLNLREQQQLEIMGNELKQEEMLFKDESLTKEELLELEYKRRVLQIANERTKLANVDAGYQMPEDYITEKGEIDRKKKEEALYGRYKEPEQINIGLSEQEQWEKQQIEKSLAKPVTQQQEVPPGSKEYDYVLDTDQIDFVMEETMFEEAKAQERFKFLDEIERKAASIKQVRDSLPIFKFRSELLSAVEEHQILIIVGETGSGKTTQIPQYLYEAGYSEDGKKIGCTQPRRVAAMSVAARVAEETGTKIGHEVGYSIRFEDCTSDRTRIKYMTDGMLLREFMTEPDLAGYSCLMIDEAHERTLHTDILFALDIARFRPDIKLLISSATMDAQKFSSYFDDAPIFKIPGRPYPVEIYNTKAPEANYLTAAVTTVLQIHASQPRGDILVFLTGQDEIETAKENLQYACRALGSKIDELIICPIYSNLPSDLQAKIFEPTPENARKVILATNIAETSITIDGVVYVIDPGFVKQNSYNPRSGIDSLQVVPCSRASANQRSGRAGRVGPGKCFRLYTQHAYMNELDDNTEPEILRVNLASVVLTLKCLGIHNLIEFDFMDPPSPDLLKLALEQLYALGALNDQGKLTKLGRRMAEFPMDPMMSRALIASEKYECPNEVASIIAMLSVSGSIFYRPKDKKIFADQAHANMVVPGGDHLMLLNVWDQWVDTGYSQQWCVENFIQFRSMNKARDTRDQIVGLMERVEISIKSYEDNESKKINYKVLSESIGIRKAITSGFFFNSAKLGKGGDAYSTVKRKNAVYIHPSSCLFEEKPKWIVYFELVLTSKEYMRQVMEIEPGWLTELAPHFYSKNEVEDESKKKMPKQIQKR